MWNIDYFTKYHTFKQKIMIATIQRVKFAKVEVENKIISEINDGLLVLLGVTHNDEKEDAEWLAKKIINLRIFDDETGVMNLSLNDLGYDILVISQFTLHAKTKKGNRPSYIDAAKPPKSEDLYNYFISYSKKLLDKDIKTGAFGANMKITLCNDGPVTINIDTKNKV